MLPWHAAHHGRAWARSLPHRDAPFSQPDERGVVDRRRGGLHPLMNLLFAQYLEEHDEYAAAVTRRLQKMSDYQHHHCPAGQTPRAAAGALRACDVAVCLADVDPGKTAVRRSRLTGCAGRENREGCFLELPDAPLTHRPCLTPSQFYLPAGGGVQDAAARVRGGGGAGRRHRRHRHVRGAAASRRAARRAGAASPSLSSTVRPRRGVLLLLCRLSAPRARTQRPCQWPLVQSRPRPPCGAPSVRCRGQVCVCVTCSPPPASERTHAACTHDGQLHCSTLRLVHSLSP